MANLENCKQALTEELNKIFNMYQARIDQNREHKHQHITTDEVKNLVTGGIAVGGAVGGAFGGAGAPAGAAAGAAAGGIAAGLKELYHYRQNYKIDHAFQVKNFLEFLNRKMPVEELKYFLEDIASRVINERAELISPVKDTDTNIHLIARYLAVNIMAAIKHYGSSESQDGNLLETIRKGLPEQRSRKAWSRTLKDENDQSITTLSAIARHNGLFGSNQSSSTRVLLDEGSLPTLTM